MSAPQSKWVIGFSLGFQVGQFLKLVWLWPRTTGGNDLTAKYGMMHDLFLLQSGKSLFLYPRKPGLYLLQVLKELIEAFFYVNRKKATSFVFCWSCKYWGYLAKLA